MKVAMCCWPDDERNAFEASGRTEKEAQYYDFTSRLLNWRKSAEVIHKGKMTQYAPEENVYVYFRSLAEESVMVIINPNSSERKLELDRFEENLSEFNSAREVILERDINLSEDLKIEGKTAYILELKK